MSKELILYYTPEKTKEDRLLLMLLASMGIRLKMIETDQLSEKVGALAGLPGYKIKTEASAGDTRAVSDPAHTVVKSGKADARTFQETDRIDDKFMILCGFTRERLNSLLSGMRRNNVPPVPIKAMLTETNCDWSAADLYRELKKEHDYMASLRK